MRPAKDLGDERMAAGAADAEVIHVDVMPGARPDSGP
jgi:hypothetical protein